MVGSFRVLIISFMVGSFVKRRNIDKAVKCYRENPKNLDSRKNCCNYPKIGTVLFYCRVMSPKDVDGLANKVDPDQTATLGEV